MTMVLTISGFLAVTVWLYLLLAHHRFWLAEPRLARGSSDGLPTRPAVLALIPARDEADVIERAVRSLLHQDYRGRLDILVVDDNSSDGTGDLVEGLMGDAGPDRRLFRIGNEVPPCGWSGKLWAMHNGLAYAETNRLLAPLLLLTDADIVHDPSNCISSCRKNG